MHRFFEHIAQLVFERRIRCGGHGGATYPATWPKCKIDFVFSHGCRSVAA
jgi:hypothetical protein